GRLHLVNIHGPFQSLPVDKYGGRRVHAKRVGLCYRGFHDGVRLRLYARLQPSGISSVLLPNFQRYVVQLVERVLHILLRSIDGTLVGVYMVCEFPIALVALLGQAIGIAGSVYRPGVDRKRIILVNNPDFVAILRQDFAHQRTMHPGAEWTLEVVEVYDRDFGIGIPTHRTPRHVDFFHGFGVGILGQIELGHADQGLAILRHQELHRLGFVLTAQSDGHGVVVRELAWSACPDLHVHVGGNIAIGVHLPLYAMINI